MTMTSRPARHRRLYLAAALAGTAVLLGACNFRRDPGITASIPDDYRLRHPIAVQEAPDSLVVFVGQGRGGLMPDQRAEVMGFAQSWARQGTGAIVADVPSGTTNARAAADSMREIQSLFAAAGVPPHGLTVRNYQPKDPRQMAAIRLSYPKLSATAGPCGVWPDDLGPSIKNKNWFDNKPDWNFGCAYQRNMAAMVDNPADLVQPRSETPSYTTRRTALFEKYRKGASTALTYPEADKAKLSDTGK